MPLQIARSPSRKPGFGGTTPMLPATGSTITQARSSPCPSASARAASRSLNAQTRVSAVTAAGTPGVLGMASVASPDPA